jgi:hypothetical protein
MSVIRVLRTSQVTVSHTFYVDEAPTDATGDVTWTLTRLDGTPVADGIATGPASNVYTVELPPHATLDALVLTWTADVAGSVVTARDVIEVVGGFLFNLADARAMPPALDTDRYPTALLAAKRVGVETECETICGQAFVPRFARVALSGSGETYLALPRRNVTAIRSITIDGTAIEVPDVWWKSSGVLSRNRGNGYWPSGAGNVVVEFEHGMEYPPEDLREAAMQRLRTRLTLTDSGVPQRAISFSIADGGVYRLSTPSRQRTGVPDVDAAYARYTLVRAGFA